MEIQLEDFELHVQKALHEKRQVRLRTFQCLDCILIDAESYSNVLVGLPPHHENAAAEILRRQQANREETIGNNSNRMKPAYTFESRDNSSTHRPQLDEDGCCNVWHCTECKRRRKKKQEEDQGKRSLQQRTQIKLSNPENSSPESDASQYYTNGKHETLVTSEDDYQPDTDDDIRLMMPLLYCEQDGCVICNKEGIVHPALRIWDGIRGAIGRLVTETTDDYHRKLCKFQAC